MQPTEDLVFAVLGPLEIRRGQSLVPVHGWREHAVLAILLMADGDAVTMSRLVEAVWDDQPPQAAVKAIRNCVSALRRRTPGSGGTFIPIESTALGYRLRLEECRFDVREFRRQADTGRRLSADGKIAQAVTSLRSALGVWRGPALAGTRSNLLQACAAHLEEQRLMILEDCLDLELALGRHRPVISELQALVREHPLRERIAGQLMLALYRSDRQADALDKYRDLGKRLAEDLGIKPGAEVTRLNEAILRQDASIDYAPVPGGGMPRSGRTGPSGPMPRPAQLPLDVPGFTGREAEMARLRSLAAPASETGPGKRTMALAAIVGAAGMGKTVLAVRFAHQVAACYPDGQLYINLRGFDPSGCPLTSGDALRRFLISLGAAAETIPMEVEGQAVQYRSLLAGKRMLILLDNAHDATQVRPLLPGSPDCLVIVTSRDQLTGLVAAEGASPFALGVLTDEESRGLLAARLGSDRLRAEPAAARELTRLCGGLPLALAIVAARAAAWLGQSITDLAAELRTASSRLDVLSTDDPVTDLRTVFSWSVRQLTGPTARMFRLLGLHPGLDITAPAAASLADLPVPEAGALLTELARRNLVTKHAPGRYALHDLLRLYAADLASTPDAPDDPHDVLGRVFDYYLSAAAVAMNLLYPADAHRRPRVCSAGPPPEFDHTAGALAWLDAERASLVAVTSRAVQGWPGHAVRLSAILERYLECGHYPEGFSIHRQVRDAARQAGDDKCEASALRALGTLYWRLGSREMADDQLRQALSLYRTTGDRLGEARCLMILGSLKADQGQHALAIEYLQRSVDLSREAGDGPSKSAALNNLADALQRVGRFQEAADYLQQALVLTRRHGDRSCEAHVLQTLAEIEQRRGSPERAVQYYRSALDGFLQLGHLRGQAWVTAGLGTVCNHLGQQEEAEQHHRHAVLLARRAGDLNGEAVALNGLGEDAFAACRASEALSHHDAALALASSSDNLQQQARAYAGIGRAHTALGQAVRAGENFRYALDLYMVLGDPDAEKVRAYLAGPHRRAEEDPEWTESGRAGDGFG